MTSVLSSCGSDMQSSKGHVKWICLKFHSLKWKRNKKTVSIKCWMFQCFQTAALSLWRDPLVSTFRWGGGLEGTLLEEGTFLHLIRLATNSPFPSGLTKSISNTDARLNQPMWTLQTEGDVCRAATLDPPTDEDVELSAGGGKLSAPLCQHQIKLLKAMLISSSVSL